MIPKATGEINTFTAMLLQGVVQLIKVLCVHPWAIRATKLLLHSRRERRLHPATQAAA